MAFNGTPEFAAIGGKILVKQGTSSYAQVVEPNVASRGIIVYPFVNSAGGGTITCTIKYQDRLGNDFNILAGLATSAAGPATPLVIYPGITQVANQSLSYVFGGRFHVDTVASGTITYSLSYDDLP